MVYKKGQSSQLMSIFVPMLVISIVAVAFGIVVADIGPRYNVSYDDTSYQSIVNQTNNINSISEGTSDSLLGTDTEQSNVLTSTERLVTGAYNAILVLGDVPGIYSAIINIVAVEVGVPSAIVNLIIAGILFAIVAVVVYLALGRI